jgi:Putative collagen-binding domain of a collagenase
MNPIFIDLAAPLRDKAPLAQQDLIRAAMGHTRAYAEKMNLAAMAPQGDLASTTYALANPGVEYLVYQPGSGAFTVELQPGTYTYEWFDPSAGSVGPTGSVTARGAQSFTPPFDGEAVLYLKRGKTNPISAPPKTRSTP